MTATTNTTIDVARQGEVDQRTVDTLIDKVMGAAAHCRGEVRRIEARLTCEAKPIRHRPAIVEVTLDVDGTPVRAHMAAPTMIEAIDLLVDRLTRRLARHEDRRYRRADRRRTGDSGDGEWRHGDRPSSRPEYDRVPFDERETRRRKTFALTPMSIEEALFDLGQLGHDFYLFVEERSGGEAVVSRSEDPAGVGACYELRATEPAAIELPAELTDVVMVTTSPPVLTAAEAKEYLDASGEKFLFHRSAADGRGQVLYRRFDGHDGLISAR
jgi:ribosome-associated translation inhibitor RaiA